MNLDKISFNFLQLNLKKKINEKKIAYVWIFKQFKCYVLGASLEFKGKCGTLLMNTCNNN